jgi:hypothetical protein
MNGGLGVCPELASHTGDARPSPRGPTSTRPMPPTTPQTRVIGSVHQASFTYARTAMMAPATTSSTVRNAVRWRLAARRRVRRKPASSVWPLIGSITPRRRFDTTTKMPIWAASHHTLRCRPPIAPELHQIGNECPEHRERQEHVPERRVLVDRRRDPNDPHRPHVY